MLNARESRWREMGLLGAYCSFEGKRRFPQLGFNINVLGPGESLGLYHRENAQEGFLVVAGECSLIVDDEVRQLRTWDFFHCPPGTEHVIYTTPQQSAVVVATGARGRGRGGVVYTTSPEAARAGACVERETTSSSEAYAKIYALLPRSTWVPYREGWLP